MVIHILPQLGPSSSTERVNYSTSPPDIRHSADGMTIGHLQSLLIDHVTHTCANFRGDILRITGKIPGVGRGESLKFSVSHRIYVVIDLPIGVRSTATPLAPLVSKLTG